MARLRRLCLRPFSLRRLPSPPLRRLGSQWPSRSFSILHPYKCKHNPNPKRNQPYHDLSRRP